MKYEVYLGGEGYGFVKGFNNLKKAEDFAEKLMKKRFIKLRNKNLIKKYGDTRISYSKITNVFIAEGSK